jgi:hypothetical protein
MDFLTLDEVAVGDAVRIIGTQSVGTVTKKYHEKIAVECNGRTLEFYPSQVRKSTVLLPIDGYLYRTGDKVGFWVPAKGSRRDSGGVVAESVAAGDDRPLLVKPSGTSSASRPLKRC